LRVANILACVDLIAWDNSRMGMGKRSRRRGDYVVVLQRPPIVAKNWRDHGIPSRWIEKVDRGAWLSIRVPAHSSSITTCWKGCATPISISTPISAASVW
jgi:hypothetical protein